MGKKIGDQFFNETKYFRDKMEKSTLNWRERPKIYKEYLDKRKIDLPTYDTLEPLSLDKTLQLRQSIRDFKLEDLSLEQLSFLLWSSNGINREQKGFKFRTAPSAGALYPIETYISVNRVKDLPDGLYHYSIRDHKLEQLKIGKFSKELTSATMYQDMCKSASVTFIWSSIFYRSKWKYGERAYRYIYLDAGHIAGNLALASTSIGLGSCQIAAFFDDEVNQLLEIDPTKESVLYLSVIGVPKDGVEK